MRQNSEPKLIINTKNAPTPIGPYSQAVLSGGFLFCSGQIPLCPNSGQIVGTNAKEQTRQVLQNIEAVLGEAGCSFSHIIKTTIFLKSMNDFPDVNAVYAERFSQDPPARSTVEVARLPKDVLVEIEVIARVF